MEKEHKSKLNSSSIPREISEEPKKEVATEELAIPAKPKKIKVKPKSAEKPHTQEKPKAKEEKKEPEQHTVTPDKVEIDAKTVIIKESPKPKYSKNEKYRFAVPFYVFVTIVLAFAFGIGALSAMFIPPINFDSLTRQPEMQQSNVENVVEEMPSVVENVTEPEPNESFILKTQPPEISSRAYGVYHLEGEEYTEITNKNADVSLPMASVTKVMTAIVAMEQYDLDKPVVVPANCVGINGSSVGFRPNDVITLQDALYGLLVKSGADAACAIANIDNEADFLAKMNTRAVELGMTSTKFTNAIGFDNSDAHVSNINDLKILVSHALTFSTFRKVVGTGEITITSKSNGNSYRIRNTNDLLFTIPGTVGIKTGYTDSAGECLAYLYQNKDQEIMIIVLGSLDRFGDTSKLLDWAKNELTTETP